MSKIRVAINGFGRIGRLTARVLLSRPEVELVAINDLTDSQTLAHLFKYDSVHGRYPGTVAAEGNSLNINGQNVRVLSEKEIENLPWKELAIDVVIESTGRFVDRENAGRHIASGCRKVVISAPAKGDIKTIVLGVNDAELHADDTILSNASCTTNCLAPVVKVLDAHFGLEQGFMSTIHAYTSDQRLQDAPHSDLRRARAAALSIIPTSTGASKAVGLVLPHLKGKLDGSSLRVPVPTGSITEFTCIVRNEVTAQAVNAAMREAANGDLKGILEYTEDPIVSADIVGNPHSSIFDADLTQVSGKLVKVSAWYDNETGYSNRLADLVVRMANAN